MEKENIIAIVGAFLLVVALYNVVLTSPTGFVIQDSKFDGSTTNFSALNNTDCVDNAVLEITGFGKIEFLDDCINFSDTDLDSHITISNNNIGIDTDNLPNQNSEVMMFLYNLAFTDPVIAKDGTLCEPPSCTIIDYTDGTLSFTAEPDITTYQAYDICNDNQVCDIDLGENWSNCRSDCICNDDGLCESEVNETYENCPNDCACNNDGICDTGEGWENCRGDCPCNDDGTCEPGFGENRTTCVTDCQICNRDNECNHDLGEDRTNCVDDCDDCNNDFVCESLKGETRVNCYNDCIVCDNNSICETHYNEDSNNCPSDCPADITSPKISGIEVWNTTYNSTKIDFNVDEYSDCEIKYGLAPGAYTYSEQVKNAYLNLTVILGPLTADRLYYFAVFCNDSSGNMGNSFERLFRTDVEPMAAKRPIYTKFDGRTTDFNSLYDLENVFDAVLEKTEFGMIEFLEDYLNFTKANLDDYVYIGDNFIYIDTGALPDLNVTSKLHIYNITFDDPGILKDNKPCSEEDCDDISYNNNILSFKVQGFGAYEAREKINMTLWDSTDKKPGKINQTVVFYAKFTYLGNIVIHDGVNCTISFPDSANTTEQKMTFDYYKKYYKYSRKFEQDGKFNFEVVCDANPIGEDYITRKSEFWINTTKECGDGICHEGLGENCSNCITDCGTCPKKNCTAEWTCTEWSDCEEGIRSRNCFLADDCSTIPVKPTEVEECGVDLCHNSILDPGEERIDCGGSCDPCPSCTDNVRNQDETGIDCGGSCDPCATCSDGVKNCVKSPDGRTICEDEIDCGGNCNPCPGCNNGFLDDGEEGIDCGGVCTEPCEAEPNHEQPNNTGIRWGLIILILVVIGLSGGGVGLYYLKPTIYTDAMEKIKDLTEKKTQGTASDSVPKQTLENYVLQNLKLGYKPTQLKTMLVRSGWNISRVAQAMDTVMSQIWGPKINQLVPIVLKMNLRRPDKVYTSLIKSKYPPYVAKMAVQKALQLRKK